MRRQEREEGREWERRFFSRTDQYPTFDELAKPISEVINADLTNGIWKFDPQKAKEAKPPFHDAKE